MSYLRSFLPWIVFAAVTAFDWRWGAVAGAVAAVLQIVWLRRQGHRIDSQLLDLSSTIFFVGVAAVGFLAPHSPLKSWTAALSLGWLGLTAWFTLAVGQPFTLGIARQSVPAQFWNSPIFRRVNVTITAVWAATFTVLGAATAVLQLTHAGTVAAIAIHAAYIVPIVFTNRYPGIVRARYASAAPAAPSVSSPTTGRGVVVG